MQLKLFALFLFLFFEYRLVIMLYALSDKVHKCKLLKRLSISITEKKIHASLPARHNCTNMMCNMLLPRLQSRNSKHYKQTIKPKQHLSSKCCYQHYCCHFYCLLSQILCYAAKYFMLPSAFRISCLSSYSLLCAELPSNFCSKVKHGRSFVSLCHM